MHFDEHQKRTLLTNLARDKAENLRNEIARIMADARNKERPDLSPEQRALGEYALQRALESAQRMIANLKAAMELSEQIAKEARENTEQDDA